MPPLQSATAPRSDSDVREDVGPAMHGLKANTMTESRTVVCILRLCRLSEVRRREEVWGKYFHASVNNCEGFTKENRIWKVDLDDLITIKP